jgi:hypothetical protein
MDRKYPVLPNVKVRKVKGAWEPKGDTAPTY